MNENGRGSEIELDRIIEAVRQDVIDDNSVEQAAQRVWGRISEASAPAVSTAQAGMISGCAGFRSLIPSYLSNELSEPRRLLLQDHFRECVPCRRALEAARSGGSRLAAYPPFLATRRTRLKWSIGAPVAAVLAVIAVCVLTGRLPWFTPRGKGAAVESIHGALYLVAGNGMRGLAARDTVMTGEDIRTAQGSQAVLRLADGSRIEMGPRANLRVTSRSRETTVHLRQGSIIVQAARQSAGRHLYVATRDCLVAVKGTIFSVTQGIGGSRVSVIRGTVVVDQGRQSHRLEAGDQLSTQASLAKVPIREDIAWSRSAGQYLAVLGEFAGIQKKLESMPGPPLRYGSRLMNYLPPNTVVYVAIPNFEPALRDAESLFEQRLQSSEVLRAWWKKQEASGTGPALEMALGEIRALSKYLGNEIVVAWTLAPDSGDYHLLVLAEVQKPGFRAFLQSQLQSLQGIHNFGLRIVNDPAQLSQQHGRGGPFIFLKNGLLAVSTRAVELRRVALLFQDGGSGGFTKTPFYEAIRQTYRSGAGWLVCANLEQIVAGSVQKKMKGGNAQAGLRRLDGVNYLILEHKAENGSAENRAAVVFNRNRQGFAAWLAPPSPMGALSFVSPNAAFASSIVFQSPKAMLEQALHFAANGDPGIDRDLARFERETHVNPVSDLAGSLGGELAIAQDGPILPSPAWEAVLEVNNPRRLETVIERLVAYFNQSFHKQESNLSPPTRQADGTKGQDGRGPGEGNRPKISTPIELTKEATAGRVYYKLRIELPSQMSRLLPSQLEIHYTFDAGYMVVGSGEPVLAQAIQNRESGYTLTGSRDFKAELPPDQSPYCSALLYVNLNHSLVPLINTLTSGPAVNPGTRQAIQNVLRSGHPSLVCAYGEPDRIALASTGGFIRLGLNALIGFRR